jgi:signal transduction histidine kinase
LESPSDAELRVYADKQVLEEIFENLISNAVKFSPFGKNVYVRVRNSHLPLAIGHWSGDSLTTNTPMTNDQYTNDHIRIEIQDEGQGISADDKEQLFKKFTRLSARPTGGEHSTGLGLSIVKKMVEAMDGRVWCESEPGNGATFIVELPVPKN